MPGSSLHDRLLFSTVLPASGVHGTDGRPVLTAKGPLAGRSAGGRMRAGNKRGLSEEMERGRGNGPWELLVHRATAPGDGGSKPEGMAPSQLKNAWVVHPGPWQGLWDSQCQVVLPRDSEATV